LFSGELWTELATGEAPRHLFLGWLIENYFFIEAATMRLPVGIAGTQDLAARRLFSKHFCEEYDHHHFFEAALAAAGIDAHSLKARTPLPTTLAICHHMREAGRRDPLAYAACSGFLESTGDDHSRAHAFFDRLTEHFDGADGAVVGPLAEHARLDEGYQHCGMLRLIADAIGPVPLARADAALESARLLVETLEAWSLDIRRHYDSPEALRPGLRRYRPCRNEPVHA
jgi:pyrroloquinoline quinone (PQQ) biosynthesis protein C